MADLVRAIDPVPEGLQMEFVRASSYGAGTVSSGKVALDASMAGTDLRGRHVLLVRRAGWRGGVGFSRSTFEHVKRTLP